MKVKLNRQNKGFTIIEVMIVLAIAGLILAIVLLAVPALQRSQRNNARTSDATHLAGLVSDYVSNHGGTVPPAAGNCATVYNAANEKFSQLTGCSIQVAGVAGTSTTNFVVDTNASCTNGTVGGGASANSFVIVWQAESAAGAANTCITG